MAVINEAAQAYSNALTQLKNAQDSVSASDAGGAGASSSSIFGDLVKQSVQSAIEAQYKSEQVSAAALSGKASMTDVVLALNDAEMSLGKVMAVRDKVIDAYQNILHTQI